MQDLLLEQFGQQLTTVYRDETYLVRDNGAVLRKPKSNNRVRRLDDAWTFGTKDKTKGYMKIAGMPVHRIVATAFHGEPPTKQHIVDHIDTNRCNNRPENLRWRTRLENIIFNPISRRRVIIAYGSVERFLENPSEPILKGPINNNFEWMRAVSKEEAAATLVRFKEWEKSEELLKGGSLGEWVFDPINKIEEEQVDTIASLTPNAVQRNWKTPCRFPLCPTEISSEPLSDYVENLAFGAVFTENEYGISKTVYAGVDEEGAVVSVISRLDGMKNWGVVCISVEEGKFVHESIKTYITLEGTIKAHCMLLGREWTDSIDDYC